jgi:hypothetical protein
MNTWILYGLYVCVTVHSDTFIIFTQEIKLSHGEMVSSESRDDFEANIFLIKKYVLYSNVPHYGWMEDAHSWLAIRANS